MEVSVHLPVVLALGLGMSLGIWSRHGKAQSSTPSPGQSSQLDFSNSVNSQLLTLLGGFGA
jgi:hypothetical protein